MNMTNMPNHAGGAFLSVGLGAARSAQAIADGNTIVHTMSARVAWRVNRRKSEENQFINMRYAPGRIRIRIHHCPRKPVPPGAGTLCRSRRTAILQAIPRGQLPHEP